MPGTPGARTGLASILTSDPATAWRTTINAIRDWLEANAMLTSSGLLSARPTSTSGAPGIAGRRYYATDTGVEYRDTGTSWIALGVELVTALPTAPYEGQIVDYLADATNGVVWRLRYRAASTSAYKWEAVGSSSLCVVTAGATNLAVVTGAWTDGAVLGPDVVAPLAGDYDVKASANFDPNGATGTNGYFGVGVARGAGATPDADAIGQVPAPSDTVFTAVAIGRMAAVTSGTVLRARYAGAVPGATVIGVSSRRLFVRPVRVG